MLKLTGGTCRGRVLPAVVPDGVRPTSARTREALFSIVGQHLDGWSFLDAFGGSGLIALEAASRGAAPVIVCERNARAVGAIQANAAAVGLVLDVRAADAASLPAATQAHAVFLDPPYADDVAAWITRLGPCAREVLVAEGRTGTAFPEVAGALPLDRLRTYGEATLAVYRQK